MKAKDELSRLQQANLPRATPAIFEVSIPDGAAKAKAEAQVAELTKYLSGFVPPQATCICCGSQLGASDIVDVILKKPTFRWGLAHGEGTCSACGYPARAIHRVGDWFRLSNYILQYHPDDLVAEREEQEV